MSNENTYKDNFEKLPRNYNNNNINTVNQSISNALSMSDMRKQNKRKHEPDNNKTENKTREVNQSKSKKTKSEIGNKQEETSNDLELYKEYVQWDFINNKLYKECENLLDIRTGKEKREFTNTLQRWFIFINEDYNEVRKYKYFTILPDIQLEHPAAQFLRDAIIEKKFANKSDADDKMRKILSFISNNHLQVVSHESPDLLHVKHDPDRKIVVVNKFQSAEQTRVNLLVEKGGLIATARMLLRYESLGNGSYQWGIQLEIREALHDKFNVRYEGFASPLNSGFIEYDDSHFCSLFPETDEPFGSIGNFFHVDMKKHADGWSLNPPFLNDLMKKVAERVIKILDDEYKGYFFCTFPWWDDDEGWNILNESGHLLKRFDLLPKHYKVQNAYGKHFKPPVKMNLFVMGNKKYICDNLQELLSSLNLIYENSL